MTKQSAGLLLYRKAQEVYEVFLVHPGGPFWAKKDAGSWSAPKGEFEAGEDLLTAAKREFQEETGQQAPSGNYQPLGEIKQSSGKVVHLFALEADIPAGVCQSNTFEMEWPPKSGQRQAFPECDRSQWFPLATAKQKLVKGQVEFIDRLAEKLQTSIETASEHPVQASLF